QFFVSIDARAARAPVEISLGPPLTDDPGVIRAFVFVAQPRYDFPRFRVADRVTFVKTIGQRQYQDSERLLVFRIRPEAVQANTLGLGGLVEEPVAHRLLQSGGNGLRR